jgi:hypothetical protein
MKQEKAENVGLLPVQAWSACMGKSQKTFKKVLTM